MIDSRSDKHPDWVDLAKRSIENQSIKVEFLVIKNLDRKHTIGKLWNAGVQKASGDYVFFLGDDDFLSECYLNELLHYAKKQENSVYWTTNMTVFNETSHAFMKRQCTGMWRRDYLLKHPFNEELKTGIDREYLEEVKKRGDVGSLIPHNFGYFYRKHEDYSCAGDIKITNEPSEIYVLARSDSFIKPLIENWDAYLSTESFDPKIADGSKIIWCDFANNIAVAVADYECGARKFLRIHAGDAFGESIKYIDFSKFEKVIFVAKHIKDYVENKFGKIPNSILIPNGVKLNGQFAQKEKNNKIAYAGQLSRKKGIGEFFLIANELPEYEFHVAGKFIEDDVAEYFNKRKPDNVILYPFQYDINEWFKDKTYILNTSLRESQAMSVIDGMAVGLKPLVYNWIGADKIYSKTFKNIKELRGLLEEPYEPEIYREFVERHYDFKDTLKQIENLLKV